MMIHDFVNQLFTRANQWEDSSEDAQLDLQVAEQLQTLKYVSEQLVTALRTGRGVDEAIELWDDTFPDIIARLRCSYSEPPCEQCMFCAARAEIERLRSDNEQLRDAGDALVAAIRNHDLRESHIKKWEEAHRG